MDQLYECRRYKSVSEWHDSQNGSVPQHCPVVGGNDLNGELIYVGRALHNGSVIPGKVVPSHGVCYVANGGSEHGISKYQVLANPQQTELAWAPVDASEMILPGCLVGGQNSNGKLFYIGRAVHKNATVVGKVDCETRNLYASFGGEEKIFTEYEILLVKHLQLV